jgi:hypothetical protein
MVEPQDDLKASDQERQHVVDELRRHMSEGRLSLDEFEDRADVAYKARTAEDLAPLTSDLPAPARPSGPPVRERPRPAAGGRGVPRMQAHGARPSVPLMSIPAFRVHLFLWLVFSAFWLVIWFGSVMATAGWVPFWPIFPIAAFGLTVGIHAAVRKGQNP